jgi:hypothetical protein
MSGARIAALAPLIAAGVLALTSAPAAARPVAVSPVADLHIPGVCGVAGVLNKAVGLACGAVSNGGALIKGGKQLITGHVGGAISTVLGGGAGTVAATASTALGLAAIGTWVVGGAAAVLHQAAAALGAVTTPQLESTWFSATYWRMAAIAALLTLPFLFAATVQAALRSDVALLARAAFGYLPLAMLGVAIAAPLTALVLSATDEMSAFVAAASNHSEASFLGQAATGLASASLVDQDPFLGFFVALITVAATVALWIELLVRAAAVDVIVLMLPLFFAAMVWPARRVWAVRAVETLIALILAKFTIVAVLSLGGAALGHATSGPAAVLTGAVLITLATLSPWALLRVLPMHEVAAAAAGGLGAVPHNPVVDGVRAAIPRRDTTAAATEWMRRHLSGDPLSEPRGAAPGAAGHDRADPSSYEPATLAGLDVVNGNAAPAPTSGAAAAPPRDDRPARPESLQTGDRLDEVMTLGDAPEPPPASDRDQPS